MGIFRSIEKGDHEQVVFCEDARSGLRAIIAIHSTALGPGLGGIRMRPYPSEQAALADALRLGEAMTKKAAVAGLALGGAKSVIFGDPRHDKTPERLRAFARRVEALGGLYVGAEDMGIGARDIDVMKGATRWVVGGSTRNGGRGDPSPATARGVFEGIKVAVAEALGASDLKGVRIGVHGIGAVGCKLARLLAGAGARLTLGDAEPAKAACLAHELGAAWCAPDALLTEDLDVFAPCSVGGVLTQSAVRALRARVVAGAANNPLASPAVGRALHRRAILYAPDFVVNAGGLIHVGAEHYGEPAAETARRVLDVGCTLAEVFARAREWKMAPSDAAEEVARRRLAFAGDAAQDVLEGMRVAAS
ncbi:MAG: Glu/Leu/Phe/Val dehydrogenase [Myxococcales bacterium]|nr:Glu/Leu/Phe/Val dehydrogenase [Myxococcales bacterium]